MISDFAYARCPQCEGIYAPVIVPPTFYKDFSNVFLSSIWNQTDVALRNVKQVIFCGYSFPDADIHIKYLLKRAQVNRNGPLQIDVVNSYPGKHVDAAAEEAGRYRRFLGPNVNYTNLSFESFSDDPMALLRTVSRNYRPQDALAYTEIPPTD